MSHRLRRGLVFVAFALALAAALPLLSRGDGPPPGDKYALLVGVRSYDKNELRNLPYTEADVTALADVLKKAGYTRVVLMTQTHGADEPRFLPEAARIRTALKGLLADKAADDTVLVAFAGHGVQFAGEDENYFCPMDAKLADKSTLIALGEVYKSLEKSEAGTRLLLADCCRNDPRSDNARAVDKVKLESVTRPQRKLPPGGVAALFSCSAGEKAYEDADLKHGVFFHFVIEGLQGKADLDKDGQVDLDELVRYTRKKVPDFVRDTFGDDVRQMPELIGKTHGNVALVTLDGNGKPDNVTEVKVPPSQPETTTEQGKQKDDYTSPTLGMKMKLIKPGKFLMGSPEEEVGRWDNEGPQHAVEIAKPFYIGASPVTKGQFADFVKDNGYQTDSEKDGYGFGYDASKKSLGAMGKYTWQNTGFAQADTHPVSGVSWSDAQSYCTWLSKKEGKTYTLPTEAEWEYACRAGTKTRYWCGDADESLKGNANIADTALRNELDADTAKSFIFLPWNDGYAFTSPVGSFRANPWGLYDMGGNVWQWCADYYGPYDGAPVKDPKGAVDGGAGNVRGAHVLRGGSWGAGPRDCRSAKRYFSVPADHGFLSYGFRVVMRPGPP